MNYPDSVEFLYALGNEIKTAKFGLDRIRTVLHALGNPQQACRFVHVAGTNGKGSTCAMIESALRAAGMHTALFTSPHLVDPTERICIAGAPVAREQFAELFARVHTAAEALLDRGAIDLHPTYFETVTAMALVAFRDAGVDMAVVEVGLGGRLDATNVVTPELCVVTPVDFDHEAFLGKSLESIAGEKAGILKPGVPAVFSEQRPEAAAVLEARADAMQIKAVHSREWRVRDLTSCVYGSRFTLDGPRTIEIECPLAGEHQMENARTAVAALYKMAMPVDAIGRGIAQTRWPGRLERVNERPEILLDGAHNPAGARVLAAHIERFYGGRKVWLIYGSMRDKAIAEVLGVLVPRADVVIATAPRQARAVRPEIIAGIMEAPALRVAPDLAAALAIVRCEAAPDDAVFVTGSLFLVGEAKALI